MPRAALATSVFEAAIDRLEQTYAAGHRVVVSFSGGKDSLAVLEVAIIAAGRTNRLPVEAVLRDEELGWPGHYEFCERTANRPEVDLTWVVAGEPHWYAYDREQPFWWSFDPRRQQSDWARQPPAGARREERITIEAINSPERFPAEDGDLVTLIGIRAQESRNRMMGVHSMGGWLSGSKAGSRKGWPIYDWSEGDVWHAIAENHWDYPSAYDELRRAGVPRRENRMGAFLNPYAAKTLPVARRRWPHFFEHLHHRFPGLRYGIDHWERVTRPQHRLGEHWQATFERECVSEAPAWIAARARAVATRTLERHANHSARNNLDDSGKGCFTCGPGRGSWERLTNSLYLGDPFSEMAASGLPYVEPEALRPELAGTPAGRWGGHPG